MNQQASLLLTSCTALHLSYTDTGRTPEEVLELLLAEERNINYLHCIEPAIIAAGKIRDAESEWDTVIVPGHKRSLDDIKKIADGEGLVLLPDHASVLMREVSQKKLGFATVIIPRLPNHQNGIQWGGVFFLEGMDLTLSHYPSNLGYYGDVGWAFAQPQRRKR